MSCDVLVVDDDKAIRSLLVGLLEDEGYQPRGAANYAEAMANIALRRPQVIVLDVWLKDKQDGLEILTQIVRHHKDVPVIMISGHATVDMAVRALHMGAWDFLDKPFSAEAFIHTVKRVLRDKHQRYESRAHQQRAHVLFAGKSAVARKLRSEQKALSAQAGALMITGPLGVGKAALAHEIHTHSQRQHGALIELSCAYKSSAQLLLELLGQEHEENAYTAGALECAHLGTLVLRDAFMADHDVQLKLAGIVASKAFTRHNGNSRVEVDTRIIVTSQESVLEDGRAHPDLLERLKGQHVAIPGLAARRDDIGDILQGIMVQLVSSLGCPERSFDPAVMSMLKNYGWPGNFWEMETLVSRLLMHHEGSPHIPVTLQEVRGFLDSEVQPTPTQDQEELWMRPLLELPAKEARDQFERMYLMFHIEKFQGNMSQTADAIGLDRTSLHRKTRSLGLLENVAKMKSPI